MTAAFLWRVYEVSPGVWEWEAVHYVGGAVSVHHSGQETGLPAASTMWWVLDKEYWSFATPQLPLDFAEEEAYKR